MGWQDYATVTVEIASLSATPVTANAAYWQVDGHNSKWQADGASPGPDGVWAKDWEIDPHYTWDSIPWYIVDCDQSEIQTSTGLRPYEWNAEAGSLSVTLWDASIKYTPIGPVGELDDIGLDTPIRIVVTCKSPAFPSQLRNKVILWSGLIRRIVHSVSAAGQHVTTINASEVVEIYGRTNPNALTTPVNASAYDNRAYEIHNRTDMPGLFPVPDTTSQIQSDGFVHAADDLHDNLWQELCMAANCHGAILFQANYTNDATLENDNQQRTPRLRARIPTAPAEPPNPATPEGKVMNRLQIRPYCSDPNQTSLTTDTRDIAVAPESLSIIHALDGVANSVTVAAAGVDGSQITVSDQASMDRWGTHTYNRNDFKLNPNYSATFLPILANRILNRLKGAVYTIDGLRFPVTCPRDIVAFVGNQKTVSGVYADGYLFQPYRWVTFVWDNPALSARAMTCSIAHSITRDSWVVSASFELWNVNATQGVTTPIPKVQDFVDVLEPV